MATRSQEPRARRAHDRADRESRARLVTLVTLSAIAVVALLAGYWWYSRGDQARDGAPNWFPDSQALVFAAEVGADPADIYRMALDGSGRRRLTDSPANDSAPAVSPDGTRVVFESDRDGNYEIYVMNADGSDQRRLTQDPARDMAPAWSPDGRRIVFTSDRDNRASADLYVMTADGTAVERLTSYQAHWSPQFAPDGRRIAVQVDRDVHIHYLDGAPAARLTREPENGMNPTWSPDGSRLAFVTTRNGRAEIFTMDADGSNQKVLVSLPRGMAIDPRWSPDGSRVAFVLVPDVPAGGDEADPVNLQAIYVVEVATGIVTRLSR